MLVGGYKTDELYQIGKNSGAILIERVPEEELRLYYQSSDIYVMPVKNKTVKYFGGFGSAPIQALACGLPVISDNIMHFPGTAEEKAQIGMEMRDEKELNENLLRIISNRKQFANCREIAQKYFDIRNTTTKKLHIFNELVQKYFE
jgi:glycosyltransferase involved in cell wall biosynthesis